VQRAISVRLRRSYYEKWIKGQVPALWDDPYYTLFPSFVQAAISIEKYAGNGGEQIDFVFDSHEVYEDPSKLQYRQLMGTPLLAGRVVDVSYKSDLEFVPLQAADLLAWQIRRRFSIPYEPSRPQYDAARKCQETAFDAIITEDDLKECRGILDSQAAIIARRLGHPFSESKEWKRRKIAKNGRDGRS
jgi:hypothetical protein